jgi:hypothetical protein
MSLLGKVRHATTDKVTSTGQVIGSSASAADAAVDIGDQGANRPCITRSPLYGRKTRVTWYSDAELLGGAAVIYSGRRQWCHSRPSYSAKWRYPIDINKQTTISICRRGLPVTTQTICTSGNVRQTNEWTPPTDRWNTAHGQQSEHDVATWTTEAAAAAVSDTKRLVAGQNGTRWVVQYIDGGALKRTVWKRAQPACLGDDRESLYEDLSPCVLAITQRCKWKQNLNKHRELWLRCDVCIGWRTPKNVTRLMWIVKDRTLYILLHNQFIFTGTAHTADKTKDR